MSPKGVEGAERSSLPVTYGITELTAQTIARGHSADSAWVLYPDTVADFDKSFEVRGGKETKLVEVTAASVPMSQPDSGFQLSASTSDLATRAQNPDEWVPNSDRFHQTWS